MPAADRQAEAMIPPRRDPMRRFTLLAVALVAAAPLAFALGDDNDPKPNAKEPGRQAVAGERAAHPGANMDSGFAACLIIDNQEEVALAELAQHKSKNAKVKEFAQKMVEDHTQFISKLEKFNAGAAGQALRIETTTVTERRDGQPEARDNNRRENRDEEKANREEKKAENREARKAVRNPNDNDDQPIQKTETRTTTTQIASGADQFLAIKREMAQECLNETAKELNAKTDKEFDQCYMTQQAMAHHKMVISLRVLKRHASENLQPVLAEGLATAEKHLHHAKDLLKSLDKDHETARADTKAKTE
jgi:predicted outer membrane protein